MTPTRVGRAARSIGLVAAILGGCKGSKAKEGPRPPITPIAATRSDGLTLPVRGPTDGYALTPVVTNALTFVVPKGDVHWAEVNYACYAAASTLSGDPTSRPGAALESAGPIIPEFTKLAGIDLDNDITAVGGFACGEAPCLYVALESRDPRKITAAIKQLTGGKAIEHGVNHVSFAAPGGDGGRTIDVRVVPVRWTGGTTDNDPWTASQLKTTHVVFFAGVFGRTTIDPLDAILPSSAATGKVTHLEQVVGDGRGRCVLGQVGAMAFQPGFQLDGARFAMVLPTGKPDVLTELMGSRRTFEVAVELTLEPAANQAALDGWIAMAKQYVAAIAEPIRAQYAAEGPALDAMFRAGALLGEQGFRSNLAGKTLRLSWRTDRIPAKDLESIEGQLEAAFAP